MAICEICTNKFRNGYKDRIGICSKCRENIENEIPNHVSDICDILKFPGVLQMDTYPRDDENIRYLKMRR
ncbi:hypothetical protein CRI83_01280 [Liquorilactobacillus nagelii]|uniref:Uncharacterized protein n=1 Tax=Liquorilactobacillus nagelii TaxID=82688 RepID=A0A3S6R0X6_9LACO|nr:hypothetical protein BSQ50_06050 [Liquorilactobacillus nagelii]MCC7615321.1 hypothetical protein [Liquorilactobacillus nagelii]